MSDKIDLNKLANNKNPELAQQAIDVYSDSLNLGLLGKFFGKKEHAIHNIIGLVLIIFLATLIGFMFWGTETDTLSKKDVFTCLLPTITTIVGYLVGKNKSE